MTGETHKKTMTKETFLYLPAKLAEGFIGIFTISCYACFFSPTAYGDYLLLNTVVIFISLVLTGWLVNSTTRFVGENMDEKGLKSFYSTAFTAWGVITLAVYALSFLVYCLSGFNLPYLCPAFMFTSYSLFQILSAALVQLRKIKLGVALSLTSACLKLIIAYAAFFISPDTLTQPYPAIAAMFFSDLTVSAAALLALRVPFSFSPKAFSRALSKQFLDYGFPLLGVSVSVGLLNLVDRFIVVGFAGNAPLAVYNANYSISSSVFTLIMAAVMRGVYPSILAAYRRGGSEGAQPLLDYGAKMYVLIAMPAAAGLIAVSPVLSRLMFVRSAYAEGIPVIGFVAAAMFFMGLTEYANKAWELEKQTLPILQNSAIAVLFKIVASILLIRQMGLTGAAAGTLIAFLCYFALTVFRAGKRFLFHIPLRAWLQFIFACLLSCGLASVICFHAPLPDALRLIAAVLAGMAAYVSGLVVCGERELLKQVLSFRKRND